MRKGRILDIALGFAVCLFVFSAGVALASWKGDYERYAPQIAAGHKYPIVVLDADTTDYNVSAEQSGTIFILPDNCNLGGVKHCNLPDAQKGLFYGFVNLDDAFGSYLGIDPQDADQFAGQTAGRSYISTGHSASPNTGQVAWVFSYCGANWLLDPGTGTWTICTND